MEPEKNTNSNAEEKKLDQPTVIPSIQPVRRLNVKTLTNNIFPLQISPNIPIKELKKVIAEISKVPVDRQRLIYMGKMIRDEDILSNYINEDDQTIHLMAKVSGENNNNATPAPPQQNTNPQINNPQNFANQTGIPANFFSVGVSLMPQNANNGQRAPQQGNNNQMFFRAVSGNNSNNIPQTLNNLLGNLMGINNFNNNSQQQPTAAPNQNPQATTNQTQNVAASQPQPQPQMHPQPQSQPQPQTQTQPQTQSQQPSSQPQLQMRPPFIIPTGMGFNINMQGINNNSNNNMNSQPQMNLFNLLNNPLNNVSNAPGNQTNANSMMGPQTQNNLAVDPNSPNQHVLSMALLLNNLNGSQTQFPGPAIPRSNVGSNPVNSLGNYLNNYQFQLLRANPFLARLSDLLLRESLITNAQDRLQLQQFARNMGQFLEETVLATRPLINLLKNIEFGEVAGNYRLLDLDNVGQSLFDANGQRVASSGFLGNNLINRAPRNNAQTNSNPNNQTSTNNNRNNQQNTNANIEHRENVGEISISFAGIEINNSNAGSNVNQENQRNNNNNSNQNQQTQNVNAPGMNLFNALGINSANLTGFLNSVLTGAGPGVVQTHNLNANSNANTSTTTNNNNTTNQNNLPNNFASQINNNNTQNTAPILLANNQNTINQQQQLPQTIPLPNPMNNANNTANIINNNNNNSNAPNPNSNNPLNMMQGNMMQNVMDYTLRDLIMENYANQLEGGDEEMLAIFGNLRIGEVVTAFLTRNLSFLSQHQSEIRQGLLTVLEKYNNDKKVLIEKISSEMKEFFLPGPAHQSLVIEGFEPNQVAMEILNKNFLKLFEIILQEYDQNTLPNFEKDFCSVLKTTFGELIYEVSEGLNNGYNDFELMFRENVRNMIIRVAGQQIAELVGFMAIPNLIPHIRNCYEEYKQELEAKEKKQKMDIEECKNQEDEENNLMEEIEKCLEKDKEEMGNLQKIEFSEEYKKGDINFKG